MQNQLFIQIGTIIAAIVPVSLVAIIFFTKIFSKYSSDLAKTTTICTTIRSLSKNIFSVKTLIFDNDIGSLDENQDLDSVDKRRFQKNDSVKMMAVTTTLCHYSKIHEIEAKISTFFKQCAIDSNQIKANYETIAEITSNREKKISTVVVAKKETQEIFAFSKGNPYKILEKCKRILINGKKNDINNNLRRKLKKKIKSLNRSGQKVIAFAYKALPLKILDTYSEQFTENELVFIGMIGLGDSPNLKIVPAIEEIKDLGIKTYILSAAKERKTVAIGKELNIVNPQYFESITSKDLEDINDQKLKKMLSNRDKDYVFCELKPADKERIIESLKENGEIIALSNQDHNLIDTLENIKRSSQNIENQQKVKFHALSCKIAELFLIITALILKAPLILTITLILAIDIFINFILGLSLRREKINNKVLTTGHLLMHGIFIGVIISTVYIWNLMRFGWYPGENIAIDSQAFVKSSSIIFVLLALIQIINAYNIRNSKKSSFKTSLLSNPYLLLTSILSLLIIYIFTNFPLFQNYLGLSNIGSSEWQIIIFASILIIIIEEIRKNLLRKRIKNENT